uniref:F-box/LRR-repeat protein 25-like n=1 Tax=Erigeron canadensis TaxID=72917 RepID=UPI001CB99E79|nr:F-box/LRR-repeat protein 25-like [Erigeron canadensis]
MLDRLSCLPDSLITDQILSRLDKTKFSIRTGTLSKRWEHLWKSVPCLFLDDFAFYTSPIHGFDVFEVCDKPFLSFYVAIDKTLNQYELGIINKFELDANFDNRFVSYINSWIEFVVSKNVKEFKMYLRYVEDEDQFSIAVQSFYLNSHFTNIELGFCLLHPTVSIRWSNLRHLTIENSELDENLIVNIMFGSPLLNSLTLRSCIGELLDISCTSVEKLVLDGYIVEDDRSYLTINAPFISSLKIIGSLWISKILLQDVSCILEVELGYVLPRFFPMARKHDEEELLKMLLIKLQHVKHVRIGVSCYAALSRLEVKEFVLPSNLIGVDVSSPNYIDNELSDNELVEHIDFH